jgi:hypothetical protein
VSARDVIKGRMEHVRRGADRRGEDRASAGRRKKWVPATKQQIRRAVDGLKIKNVEVKGILVDITIEANEAYKDIVADNERMRAALERLLGLGELCTTCDAASVREFALAGLGRKS